MLNFIKSLNPFKSTLSGILASFQQTVDALRKHADDKTQEAARKEAKAIDVIDKASEKAGRIMDKAHSKSGDLWWAVNSAEAEAEDALNAADKIASLIGGAPASL